MAVMYKPSQSRLKDKETGKHLFYPRVVRAATVGMDELSNEIAELSSLSPGDVKNTLENLVTVMARHIQASESVTVDGLGTFRPVMLSRSKGVEDPNKVKAAMAMLTVRFQPSITRNHNGTTQTRALVTGAKCVRYDKLTKLNLGDGEVIEEEPGGIGGEDTNGGENVIGGENVTGGGNTNGSGSGNVNGGNVNGNGSTNGSGNANGGSKDETPYPIV